MKPGLRSCLLLCAFAAAPAAAQKAAPAADGPTIVVTARSLDETGRALEACLARKCPPLEDMAATIAHAENLFIGGEYARARSTVEASMRRNDRFAQQHPREVATLYRADARISIHLGDGETYRSSTYGAVRALRKGLDKDDGSVLTGRFEVAEMLARLGDWDGASSAYAAIADDAARAGARDLAANARLRRAWLDYRQYKTSNYLEPIEKIAESTDPGLGSSRIAALVLLARVDRQKGGSAVSDRLLKALAQAGGSKQTLVWAPQIEVAQAGEDKGPSYNDQNMGTSNETFDKMWADVGFWVKPDGSVSEVEVLRSSGSQAWLKPVLSSIGRRAYTPSPESSGSYRVERYTWTALLRTAPIGSRMAQREPQGRIEYVDLTVEAPGEGGTR